MIEDFIDALRSFSRSKTRTVLSLLGVIIGVASVIVITSIGKSSTKQIENTFLKLISRLFFINTIQLNKYVCLYKI